MKKYLELKIDIVYLITDDVIRTSLSSEHENDADGDPYNPDNPWWGN